MQSWVGWECVQPLGERPDWSKWSSDKIECKCLYRVHWVNVDSWGRPTESEPEFSIRSQAIHVHINLGSTGLEETDYKEEGNIGSYLNLTPFYGEEGLNKVMSIGMKK